MSNYLFSIQETVIKYAKVLSQVTGINVEVVDNKLFRIAGTGIFENKINRDMSEEGYVYNHVIRTGERSIVYNPGKEAICLNCPTKSVCKETFEISTPIKFKDNIIGVIGMVGTDLSQKEKLENNLDVYLQFIDQIADFISAKVSELQESRHIKAVIDALNMVIDSSKQGVILINEDFEIVSINKTGKRELKLNSNLTGKKLIINETGDSLNKLNEYLLKINQKEYKVMGEIHTLKDYTEQFSKILIFQNISNVQSDMYELISTINQMDTSNIIGNSEKTMKLKNNILRVAKSTSTILITGESGTGKEMVATAIWKASDRSENKFVAINCGAIPEPLLESELFGYVKGAFTGADPNGRMGKFELANNGIIFLDEIGDMPLYLQVKLLRVLQEKKISRIGSNQIIPIDVRVIAATNKDLKNMIEENTFREDLYYRLNVIPMEIEPLRNRKEDIESLTYYFIDRYSKHFNKKFLSIDQKVMEKLKSAYWKGNVRELENVIEFMINMMGENGILDLDTMPTYFLKTIEPSTNQEIKSLAQLEKEALEQALNEFGNTVQGKQLAAKALGIGIATLYRKVEKYNI